MPKKSTKTISLAKNKALPQFEIGSDNIYADIGVANPDVALAKADVAREIARGIAAKRLTQAAAARVLGIDQPRVSSLLKGRLSPFSLEKLMGFVVKLGSAVEMRVVRSAVPTIRMVLSNIAGPGVSVLRYEQYAVNSPVVMLESQSSLPSAWLASKLVEDSLEIYQPQ